MRIPDRILDRVEKQLDADCGIGGEESRVTVTGNGTALCRAPRGRHLRHRYAWGLRALC